MYVLETSLLSHNFLGNLVTFMSDDKHEEYDTEAVDGVDGAAAGEEDVVIEGEGNPGVTGEDTEKDEKELEELRNKLAKMEEEAKKVEEMFEQVENDQNLMVDKEELDSRSVYIGNVDYSTKPKELQEHFQACGTILRVTILCDKWTGHPKGFAYIEFMDKAAVANAMGLNESIFKGRPLKVMTKRTNIPGFARGRRASGRFRRGGGGRFRARRPRGRFYSYSPYY